MDRRSRWLANRQRAGLAIAAALVAAPLAAAIASAATSPPSYTETVIRSPAPEATPLHGFGGSLAAAGDTDGDSVPEIIAGDDYQTVSGQPGAGRAWVIDGGDGRVLLTLSPPVPQADAYFGEAVVDLGVVGGVDEVAVAAPRQDVSLSTGGRCVGAPPPCLTQQGQVYVFSAATGARLFTINAPDTQGQGARFGSLLAAPGDLNGDGVPDLIVTEPGEDAGPLAGSGEAFAFSGRDGSLLWKVKNPVPESGAAFGDGISVPGDVNGDGVNDIVIGAPGATGGGQAGEGRAYVISGRDGSVLRSLDDPAPQPPGTFGVGASFGSDLGSKAAPGDVNGDGVPDIYVDAPGQDVAGVTNAGEAFIFSGRDGTLVRSLANPLPEAGGRFGWAFANAGDLTADGVPDLLVGQLSSGDPNGPDAGAWVFDGMTGRVLIRFPGGPLGPGDTVAAPGDVNGDGCPDFFLGSPSATVGANVLQGQIVGEISAPGPSCRPLSTQPVLTPIDSTPPAIAGKALVGRTLTVVHGSWLPAPAVYSYLWERCDRLATHCGTLPGATKRRYRITTADAGSTIRVLEAASAGGPYSAWAASRVTAPIPPAGTTEQAARVRGFRRCLAAAKHPRSVPRARPAASARPACVRRWGRIPGRVLNLRVTRIGSTGVTLNFVAPGTDRGRPPAAQRYLITQSAQPIRSRRAFASAPVLCGGACGFAVTRVGTRIALRVTSLRPGTRYCYTIAALDNVTGLIGPASRSVAATTRG